MRTVYEILYVGESVTETEYCHKAECLNFLFRPGKKKITEEVSHQWRV